ncbi:Hypothetical predicted protein, partial [Pelobates cultripes]
MWSSTSKVQKQILAMENQLSSQRHHYPLPEDTMRRKNKRHHRPETPCLQDIWLSFKKSALWIAPKITPKAQSEIEVSDKSQEGELLTSPCPRGVYQSSELDEDSSSSTKGNIKRLLTGQIFR